jgi:hypothetical protein
MRRREFIAGLGATITGSIQTNAQELPLLPLVGHLDDGPAEGFVFRQVCFAKGSLRSTTSKVATWQLNLTGGGFRNGPATWSTAVSRYWLRLAVCRRSLQRRRQPRPSRSSSVSAQRSGGARLTSPKPITRYSCPLSASAGARRRLPRLKRGIPSRWSSETPSCASAGNAGSRSCSGEVFAMSSFIPHAPVRQWCAGLAAGSVVFWRCFLVKYDP